MDSSIVSAAIGAIASIIVAMVYTHSSFQKIFTEMQVHNARQDEKIEKLTESVNKHNQVVERQFKLEARMDVLEAKDK